MDGVRGRGHMRRSLLVRWLFTFSGTGRRIILMEMNMTPPERCALWLSVLGLLFRVINGIHSISRNLPVKEKLMIGLQVHVPRKQLQLHLQSPLPRNKSHRKPNMLHPHLQLVLLRHAILPLWRFPPRSLGTNKTNCTNKYDK